MAVNHPSEPVGGLQSRDEAYRLAAELLVGYRRIIHRGLVKLYGDDWLDGGCPDLIRDRLAERQAAELEVERTTSEGADLIHYTVFADLVDLLKANKSLTRLLDGLASSPEGLTANLKALEDIRRQIAGARFLSDSETVVLGEMHQRLRQKLIGARRKARRSEPATPVEAAAPPTADRKKEPEQSEPDAVETERPGATTEVEAFDQKRRDATDELFAPQAETFNGSDLVDREFLDGAATPVGLVNIDRDDLEILGDLRREVVVAAESAYGNVDEISIDTWTGAWDSGWYAAKVETYGLLEVAKFYAIMEQYLDGHHRGDDQETLRKFLADREFAKLLLRLRDLFDRLRV